MDAIKEDKELFTLLSNKDLSWNKNEGVKFVTTAMDKTIRIGGIAVATMATFAVNSIRKLGSKIHKENKDLAAAHNAKKAGVANEKTNLANAIDASQTRKTDAEAAQNAIIAAHGSKTQINNNVTNTETARNAILADLVIPAGLEPSVQVAALDIRQHLWNNLYKSANDRWTDAKNVQNDFINATNELKSASDELDAQQKEMSEWDDNHKDRYEELIKYWNKLEFGRDMHLGRIFGGHYSRLGSKKTQQDNYYQMFNNGMTKAA